MIRNVPKAMLRVAFWNTGKCAVAALVAELVASNNVNMLILAERGDSIATLLDVLAERTGGAWWVAWGACERITIFTSFPDSMTRTVHESDRFTIRRVMLPGMLDVLIAAVHLRSKLHQSERSQPFSTLALVSALNHVEASIGHDRSVIVGDLNMNPYDDGVLAAGALHAVMTRRTARKVSRIVHNEPYRFFYNPMWGLLGDRSSGPPGTYRYLSAEHVCAEWHIFDQVLVRPALLEAFPADSAVILDHAGAESLLTTNGLPSPSDHLPIMFQLNEPGESDVN